MTQQGKKNDNSKSVTKFELIFMYFQLSDISGVMEDSEKTLVWVGKEAEGSLFMLPLSALQHLPIGIKNSF